MSSDVTTEEHQEWERICRERIEPTLGGEKLLCVGPFTRKVWWGGWSAGQGELGAFFGSIFDEWRVARGARLPRNFLLALTTDKVHIFDYSGGPMNPVVGRKVLIKNRENVRFVGTPKELTLRLTGDVLPGDVELEGDRLNLDPLAAEVLTGLSG